eukprot:TRINITY_DN6101_c0_g1_i1.p1 TRINITY_DN6101_c0_g1~~TRINITY_DN6101_c0_g1_i1.p1  ORF type:complete len:585 (+),score=88.68 TRINITY_DN6101_c0_g1_i1:80-1756(+)
MAQHSPSAEPGSTPPTVPGGSPLARSAVDFSTPPAPAEGAAPAPAEGAALPSAAAAKDDARQPPPQDAEELAALFEAIDADHKGWASFSDFRRFIPERQMATRDLEVLLGDAVHEVLGGDAGIARTAQIRVLVAAGLNADTARECVDVLISRGIDTPDQLARLTDRQIPSLIAATAAGKRHVVSQALRRCVAGGGAVEQTLAEVLEPRDIRREVHCTRYTIAHLERILRIPSSVLEPSRPGTSGGVVRRGFSDTSGREPQWWFHVSASNIERWADATQVLGPWRPPDDRPIFKPLRRDTAKGSVLVKGAPAPAWDDGADPVEDRMHPRADPSHIYYSPHIRLHETCTAASRKRQRNPRAAVSRGAAARLRQLQQRSAAAIGDRQQRPPTSAVAAALRRRSSSGRRGSHRDPAEDDEIRGLLRELEPATPPPPTPLPSPPPLPPPFCRPPQVPMVHSRQLRPGPGVESATDPRPGSGLRRWQQYVSGTPTADYSSSFSTDEGSGYRCSSLSPRRASWMSACRSPSDFETRALTPRTRSAASARCSAEERPAWLVGPPPV